MYVQIGDHKGIGFAAAKRFIDEGAKVIIFGRGQEALDSALTSLGPNASAVRSSVTSEADRVRLYENV